MKTIKSRVFNAVSVMMILAVLSTATMAQSLLGVPYQGTNRHSGSTGATAGTNYGNCGYGTPYSTGKIVDFQSNAQLGTWEAYKTTSNAYGFWFRVWMPGSKLWTVSPYRTNPDGSISLWWIEYQYYSGNPCDTKFWQETFSGDVIIYPSTATANSLAGNWMAKLQMVGYQRVNYRDNWRSIKLVW